MAKPRVILADEDVSYIVPLQCKLVKDFYNKIDLEIITDRNYFNEFFSKPQKAEILIVSDELYDPLLQKHNIFNTFVMMEQMDEDFYGDSGINRIYKYTSIKEIFNEVVGKSVGVLNVGNAEKKETQIVLVSSASGGAGKTTISMGIAACLAQSFKRVLYINAERLQSFQHMLDNDSPISSADVYGRLANPNELIYEEIKHVIRKEMFSYLPAFKAAIMSIGARYSIFSQLAWAAKKSGDYDFIIIDAESTFDEEKTRLIDMADKVVIVTDQSANSVQATNALVSNINGVNTDKYLFVCNKFDRDGYSALIVPDVQVRFTINEYVEKFETGGAIRCEELSRNNSIKKVSFLVI